MSYPFLIQIIIIIIVMAETTNRRKALQLKKPVTRDSFYTWNLNHQAFCNQETQWRQFLPGGTRSTWIAKNEDETRGLTIYRRNLVANDIIRDGHGNPVVDEGATNNIRAALQNFLIQLGNVCPTNYMHTVEREATSYDWVMNQIKTDYKLRTRGLGFLAGADIKVDFTEEGQTYQQGFQALKEFYSDALLKSGDKYRGTAFPSNEPFSPLAANMLVERWLDMINPLLRSHIMKTRGHLITTEKPNLSDIQPQLCEQIDVMLTELENLGSSSVNATGFGGGYQDLHAGLQEMNISRTGFQGPRHNLRGGPPRFRGQGGYGGAGRGLGGYGGGSRGQASYQGGAPAAAGRPMRGVQGCPSDSCIRCFEAGRFGASSKTHFAATCPYKRVNTHQAQPMKVLLIPAGHNQHTTPSIQEVHLQPDILRQFQPGYLESETQEEEHDYQNYQGEGEEESHVDFMNHNENKYSYYCPALPDSNESIKPTVGLVPTRSFKNLLS